MLLINHNMCIAVYFTQALQKSFHALDTLTKIELAKSLAIPLTNLQLKYNCILQVDYAPGYIFWTWHRLFWNCFMPDWLLSAQNNASFTWFIFSGRLRYRGCNTGLQGFRKGEKPDFCFIEFRLLITTTTSVFNRRHIAMARWSPDKRSAVVSFFEFS